MMWNASDIAICARAARRSVMRASAVLHRREVECEVERRRRMGEGAGGDPVDPGLGDRPHRAERDAAGRLEEGPSLHQPNTLAQRIERHVVEEDDVRACGHRTLDLL